MKTKLTEHIDEKVDEIDKKIINELSANSKITLRELSKKLKVSFVTVMNRIKKLENEGVIEGYTAKINHNKLGYDINVVIDVRIPHGRFDEFEKELMNHPCIYRAYDVTGEFDAVVLARFKNTKKLTDFLEEFQKLPCVEKTNTKLILYNLK
jgi:Lrp/AsnC family transcriptional regulator for asnA, asnC and gidA